MNVIPEEKVSNLLIENQVPLQFIPKGVEVEADSESAQEIPVTPVPPLSKVGITRKAHKNARDEKKARKTAKNSRRHNRE